MRVIHIVQSSPISHFWFVIIIYICYVTVGTFARRGLSSTAKTLRSLSGVRGSEY